MPARRADPAAARLPADLAGPVDVELSHLIETLPAQIKPGTLAIEPKWDGYRLCIVRSATDTRLWSRKRKDLTDRFPDIAAAAAGQLAAGVVLDEICISINGKLSFDALQRRLVTSPAKARQLVADFPAAYIAFDLLAYGGVDLRTQRYSGRRQRLEDLAAGWRLPLQLTPVTYYLEEAREWFEILPAALGTEGLVLKPTSSRYVGGRRSAWSKVKHRETREVSVGGVLGPIARPESVVAGLYRGSDLVVVGRTVALTPAQSAELAAVLRPAKPNHPWPDEISSQRWDGRDSKKPLTKVDPVVIAEVTADVAAQAGQARHPLRFIRVRADLTPPDLTPAV